MKNWLRKWLGIDNIEVILVAQRGELLEINTYLDSREPCKACGHHRYKKRPKRHGEIERDRKLRSKGNANGTSARSREI